MWQSHTEWHKHCVKKVSFSSLLNWNKGSAEEWTGLLRTSNLQGGLGFYQVSWDSQACICPDERWMVQASRGLECHGSGWAFAIIWLSDLALRGTTTQEEENAQTANTRGVNSLQFLHLKSKRLLSPRLHHWRKCTRELTGETATISQLKRITDLKVIDLLALLPLSLIFC